MWLADCGNTCLKFARFDGRLGDPHYYYIDNEDVDLTELPVHEPLLLLPGGQRAEAVLRAWWQGPIRCLGSDVPLPVSGVYAGCGLDRQCAGVAALADDEQVIVVQLGTAVTVDAWRRQGGLAHFLGGQIGPGPETAARALRQTAPGLPPITWQQAVAGGQQACGASTRACLAAALWQGYPGQVAAQVISVRAATGIDDVRLSGGYAESALVARLQAVLSGSVQVLPDAVLRGMARLIA